MESLREQILGAETRPTSSDSVAEMLAYLGIAECELREAHRAWQVIDAALDGMLDRFYAEAERSSLLPTLSNGRVVRLKDSQKRHWRKLINGPFDQAFDLDSRRIGLRHRQHGLPPWTFAMTYMRLVILFLEALDEAERTGGASMRNQRTAIVKIMALDLAHSLSAYGAELID